MAQPPVPPDVEHAWSANGVKYTCEAPPAADELSMTMPLVPPVTEVAARAVVAGLKATGLVLNDMMHPVVLEGQPTAVLAFPPTLTNIRSVVPLKNSVTGEQGEFAVAIVGPWNAGPLSITPDTT